MSPVDLTPVAVRRVVHRPNPLPAPATKNLAPAPANAQDEDEEELLPLDQMLAKRQKEAEAKKLAEQKAAEAKRFAEMKAAAAAKGASGNRARRATTVLSDSDSDLEIEGAPAPIRSRVFGTPGFDRSSTPRALTANERKIRGFGGPPSTYHQEEDASESQLAEAGHTFGRDLMANHHIAAPRRRTKKGPKPQAAPAIDSDTLNRALLNKAKAQSLDMVIKKRSAFVRRRNEEEERQRLAGPEVAKVDVKSMLEKKENALRDAAEKGDGEDEDDEDGADEDYEEEEAQDSDVAMESGSDVQGPSSSQRAVLDEEAEEDAEAEGAAPQEDEDEEESMPAPILRGKKVRLQVASDDEDEETAPTAAPTLPATVAEVPFDIQEEGGRRIAFPGLDDAEDRGFSQFFDSQFSQEVGNVNDVSVLPSVCTSDLAADPLHSQVEGFHRPNKSTLEAPAPTLLGHVFLNTQERAEDVELLENRGDFRDVEPNTPREAAAPRQYINKQGYDSHSLHMHLDTFH